MKVSRMVTLTFKRSLELAPVDGAVFQPLALCQLEAQALAATPVRIGRVTRRLDEICEISFEVFADDSSVANDAEPVLVLKRPPMLDGLGACMAGGQLIIEGDAGHDLGASMRSGLIRVTGQAGDRVGGPAEGVAKGMTGGEILVDGDAGDHVGFRMRRGLIAVGGRVGASPGYQMIAGTVLLMRGGRTDSSGPGGAVDYPGLEMRRGSVIYLNPRGKLRLGPTFAEEGVFSGAQMPAMGLVLRRLQGIDWSAMAGARGLACLDALHAGTLRWRLFSGDQLELNRGEVLQWVS